MDDNLDVIFNTISQQSKGLTSKITANEWNFIVNVLSKQSNHNAKVLKNLKNLFQRIKDSGRIGQEEIDEFKNEIRIIQATLSGKADLIGGKVPKEQLPDLTIGNQIHIGPDIPDPEDYEIWFKPIMGTEELQIQQSNETRFKPIIGTKELQIQQFNEAPSLDETLDQEPDELTLSEEDI